jgi:cytochrome c556
MATSAQPNEDAGSRLKAFEDKIRGQVEEAKTRLEQVEAAAKQYDAQAATAAVTRLKTAKEDIDRKLKDLRATHDAHMARAKSEIETDVARFKASVEEVGAKIKPAKK